MRSLRLSAQQIQVILKAVDNAYPHEACGIIGGRDGDAIRIIPVANVAENRESHYRLDPEEQLQALLSLEAEHLEWIGVFHSHPNGKPIPSLDDIQDARLNTPNLIHLIVGMRNRQPELQAWHINNGQVDPVDLLISKQKSETDSPASRTEIWAVLFAVLVGVIVLLAISFILLPPAPPIPTPQ